MSSALSSASALVAGTAAASRTVNVRDGTIGPPQGQGPRGHAQRRHPEVAEEEALRNGLSLGMTLIDPAEIYGGGRSESLISRVIADQRDRVFLVSKVWP